MDLAAMEGKHSYNIYSYNSQSKSWRFVIFLFTNCYRGSMQVGVAFF